MATASGTENPSVDSTAIEERLRESPCSFEFFQAVRLLQRLGGTRQPIGRFASPAEEAVRFHVHNTLSFPASQIHTLDWPNGGPPQMAVNFMGLTGPLGVLPYCYTELILERARAKDETLSAFFDLFNHRIISLFYQAWEKYRFPIAYERGEFDRFSHHLMDLVGLGTEGLQDRQSALDESLMYYTGLLGPQPRSAAALEQMLSDYFDVRVEVEQFAGAWYRLDPDTQCEFQNGDSYSEQLGLGAVVGDEIWDHKSRVRIKVGPLTLAQYLDFLPEGTAYEPLRALTRFFSNDEFEFEVQLILKQDQVPRCEMGGEGETAPRLGWVTWARSGPLGHDAGDTILKL
ncbi:MAG TPA: type VI secretion system baseplate subunit TssG [Terriglobia bacterium]|nr:type VI secretion system baseplate subunit TssG [Terriglobia bacterium]